VRKTKKLRKTPDPRGLSWRKNLVDYYVQGGKAEKTPKGGSLRRGGSLGALVPLPPAGKRSEGGGGGGVSKSRCHKALRRAFFWGLSRVEKHK